MICLYRRVYRLLLRGARRVVYCIGVYVVEVLAPARCSVRARDPRIRAARPHTIYIYYNTLEENAGDDHIVAYADGEAGGKQYQPHASIRGHLAPEDEHAALQWGVPVWTRRLKAVRFL